MASLLTDMETGLGSAFCPFDVRANMTKRCSVALAITVIAYSIIHSISQPLLRTPKDTDHAHGEDQGHICRQYW